MLVGFDKPFRWGGGDYLRLSITYAA
jgi:hypothetical protein